MNRHLKYILLIASALPLLVSACTNQSLEGVHPIKTPRANESVSTSKDTLNPIGIERTESAGSIQIPVTPSGPEELGDVDFESIPNAEERDAILDQVNLGGPELLGDDETVGEGPAPGTESLPAPGQSPDDILERVNPGGPELPPSDEISEESAPGTESHPVPGQAPEDILERVNPGGPELSPSNEPGEGPLPGTESDKAQNSSTGGFFSRLIETLRNWLRGFQPVP